MDKIVKAGIFIRTWALRLLPVIIFAALGVFISVQIDRHFIEEAPGEDFLSYTQFTVNNAREGEDVYFTVCRDHDKNYNFDGKLDIYEVRTEDGKTLKVYARDIQGQVSNDCDNKVVKASSFHHTPNVYEMSFCVDFKVKYDIQKTVCKTSNHYTVYAQPNDLSSQIQKAEQLLAELRARQSDSTARGDTSGQPSNLSTNPPAPQPAQSTPPAVVTNPTPTPQSCVIDTNILGLLPVKIACSSS